jgi:hypothetical protein
MDRGGPGQGYPRCRAGGLATHPHAAASGAAMQNSTSLVFDTHPDSIFRVDQSTTATRYRKPGRIGR